MVRHNVPTKIDLYTDNLVVFNSKDFRVAPLVSIRLRHFIGYNDFVVVFYEPQKIELLTLPGSGPASREVSGTIQPHIRRAGESKILSKMLLKKFSIACSKSLIRSLCQTAWTGFRHKLVKFAFPISVLSPVFLSV